MSSSPSLSLSLPSASSAHNEPKALGRGGEPTEERQTGQRRTGGSAGRTQPRALLVANGGEVPTKMGKSDYVTGREAATRPRHEPQGAPVDWLGFVRWHWVGLGQAMHLQRRGGAGIFRVHMRLHGAWGC